MKSFALEQIFAVIRLELRKTFFARRGLWVYLLALAPVLLYAGHSIYAPRQQRRLAQIAAAHPISTAALDSVTRGLSEEDVIQKLGQPYARHTWRHGREHGGPREHTIFNYTDGARDFRFVFFNGRLGFMRHDNPDTLLSTLHHLCHGLSVLLPAIGDLLRMRRHFHEPVPR